MSTVNLIAPKQYNIIMEVEKHLKDENKIALISQNDAGEKRTVTYKQLLAETNKIGNAFLNAGLAKGDKILVMLPKQIETYAVYLAALKTGIILIPCSEMLRTKDLQYRVTHGEVSGVVSEHSYLAEYKGIKEYDSLTKFVLNGSHEDWLALDELKEQASSELAIADTTSDTIAFLPYTSGTTSDPKGVVHTHAWGYAHLRTVAENWLDVQDGDIVWATASPGWQKWIWSPFLSVLGSGASGFIYTGKFSPEKYLSLINDQKITVLCCTPTEYRLMANVDNLKDYQLSHLRSSVSAGEPLNREVIEIFEEKLNITVRDGYGQTENTLLLGIMKDMEVKPGSMGKPTPGNEVEVIDELGEPVAVHEVGDIALKLDSPALFIEYYKDPERTIASRRGDYYITGDRAKKDDDGYFWFEGRSDDIIISSGYTIGPFEVEDALVRHAAVQECAVVASPDPVRGNIVKAFVVLNDGFTDSPKDALIKDLQEHTKALTAPYKYPREIEFIDEMPKTTSGKVRRVELRNMSQKA